MAYSIKAILFDLDETILDRSKSLEEFVLWQAQGMLRNSISDDQKFFRRFIELDNYGKQWKDKVYSQLIDEFKIADWSVSELLQSYELCFAGFCKPKEHIIEVLQLLKTKGYKLGLVSNGKSPFQQRNFNALGVSHLFSTVIVSEEVGFRKPEKEIFELACQYLNMSAEEVVFVGDNPEADIDGANNVGMYTIYIPGHFGKSYSKADAVCASFSNLIGIIRNAT